MSAAANESKHYIKLNHGPASRLHGLARLTRLAVMLFEHTDKDLETSCDLAVDLARRGCFRAENVVLIIGNQLVQLYYEAIDDLAADEFTIPTCDWRRDESP